MASEKIKLQYGKWHWDTRYDAPILPLYPFLDRYIACLRPSIRFDKPIELVLEKVAKKDIAAISLDLAELDY